MPPLPPREPETLSDERLYEAFMALAGNKATGWDGIPKELIDKIPGLYNRGKKMLRMLWNSEVLPDGFVRGMTLLFYKGGGKDKNDCDSYRPVTCLLHFYKWFAVLVLKQLVEECSWFLPELQAGFRKSNVYVPVQVWSSTTKQGRGDVSEQAAPTISKA